MSQQEVQWRIPKPTEDREIIENATLEFPELPEKIKSGKLALLGENLWAKLKNSTSWTIKVDDLETVKALAQPNDLSFDELLLAFRTGKTLPAPIVFYPYLITGNTRLMMARAFAVVPLIFLC